MNAKDCWEALAKADPGARVVLQLADGREIEVSSLTHYAGLVVIAPSEPIVEDSWLADMEQERDEAVQERDEALARADKAEQEIAERDLADEQAREEYLAR